MTGSIHLSTGAETDINVVEIRNLTKDYGSGKGIFDVTLGIRQGEVYGYLVLTEPENLRL